MQKYGEGPPVLRNLFAAATAPATPFLHTLYGQVAEAQRRNSSEYFFAPTLLMEGRWPAAPVLVGMEPF